MARLARLYAPSTVQHIVQRPAEGRNLFIDEDDYALFVSLLGEAVRAHALSVHAYVLLPSEVRLLATPGHADSVARTMQAIGRCYVPHLNRKTGRSGPLWTQRYRSTLIDADRFMLDSMRLVEHRPVAAGHVAEPREWRWSSHLHHVGSKSQPFLSDHAHYWALSDTPFARQAAYRKLFDAPLDAALVRRIDEAVERGWVLGDPTFVVAIESQLNRRALPLARGRPRRLNIEGR